MPVTKTFARYKPEFSIKNPAFFLGIKPSTVGFFLLIGFLCITGSVILVTYAPFGNTGFASTILYYLEEIIGLISIPFILISLGLYFVGHSKGRFYFFDDHFIQCIGGIRLRGNYEKIRNVELNTNTYSFGWQVLSSKKKKKNWIIFDLGSSYKFRLGKKNRTGEFEEFLKQHLDLT